MSAVYDGVFFVGAGASCPFGLPATAGILKQVLARLSTEELYGSTGRRRKANAQARRMLRNDLRTVFPTLKPTSPPPITDLFSLIDHMIASHRVVSRRADLDTLSRLRAQLVRATLWVFAHPKERAGKEIQRDLGRFITKAVEDGRRGKRRCFITTNYDRILEMETLRVFPDLHSRREIDYGAQWREPIQGRIVDRPSEPAVGIFKLHGSSSWLACPACDNVYIRPEKSLYTLAYWPKTTDLNSCHCGYGPLTVPIVAPSMLQSIAVPTVNAVWGSSLEALRSARRWTFVGYSLPNEDIAIRALLMRAYRNREARPEVDVVLYNDGSVPSTLAYENEKSRYEFMFPKCRVSPEGFGSFLAKQ